MLDYRKSRQALAALCFCALVSCGGDAASPGPVAPAITVNGVLEGGSYPAPISIEISLNKGTYTATLNDQPYISGQPITQPGAYTLQITARDGSAIANRMLHFTVTGGTAPGVTVIRLINLGANDAGGGGDAILITDSSTSGVRSALVDAGPAGAGGSDFAFVANRLKALKVDSLDFVMLSHAHSDHYAGLLEVFNAAKVKRFYYNGQVRSTTGYQSAIAAARTEVGLSNVIIPTAVSPFRLGNDSAAVLLTIIPPLPTYLNQDTDDGTLINEGSIGMQLKRGSFEMFFTGDGEVEATRRWRTTYAAYTTDIEVLKVGHHGANNAIFDNGFSGTSSWLAQTDPEVSVISANGTTHPRSTALNALLSRTNNKTYCTNVHGDIVIRVTSNGAYSVIPEKNANQVCVKGTQADT